MFNWKSAVLILSSFLHFSHQRSTPEDKTYVGAVVEYSPCNQKFPESIWWNVLNYADYIEEASKANADIIVFPESGLTGYENNLEEFLQVVPDPKNKSVPCTDEPSDDSEIVRLLSCEAWLQKIYVVVNLPEKVPCTKNTDKNCPAKGRYRYNTNVVFDRNGAVIARYRKYNLYDEYETNKPQEPEAVFFDTDFGVRFGTFICFDILFAKPAIDLVTKHGVTDIAFSTAWFSELPFLTALQAQQGWAFVQDVNFLGSGYNNVTIGSGGSGIYLGRNKSFTRIMPEKKTSQLLIFEIPKKGRKLGITPFQENQIITQQESGAIQKLIKALISALQEANSHKESIDCPGTTEKELKNSLHLMPDSLNNYKSYLLNPKEDKGKFEKVVCDGDEFCCTFDVAYETGKLLPYRYRLVAFNGVRKYGKLATGGVQICGLVLCTGTKITSCSLRPSMKNFGFNFTKIVITGNFLNVNGSQIPTTLTDGDILAPLSSDSFTYTVVPNGSNNTIEIALKIPQNNLTTFGIYGRVFSNDGKPSTSKSNIPTHSFLFLVTIFCLLMYVS